MSKAKSAPAPALVDGNADTPPQTATQRQAEAQAMLRDCHARIDKARAALAAMSLKDAPGRREARRIITEAEQESRDLTAEVEALEPARRAEWAAELHAAKIARFDRAEEVLSRRQKRCAIADKLMSMLADVLAEAQEEENEARGLTGAWDFASGVREGLTIGEPLGDALLANFVRLGVLPIEHLPDRYNTEVVPIASVRTLEATAQALTADVLARRPTAAETPQGAPAPPVSYTDWATQSLLLKEPPPAFAAAERTGTPAPVPTFGPAAKMAPILFAELDQDMQLAHVHRHGAASGAD